VPFLAYETLGAPTTTVGPVLSTVYVVEALEAVDVLPSASLAAPAPMVIPRVPSPVEVVIVTVGLVVEPFDMAIIDSIPTAEPEVPRETLAGRRL